MQRDNAAHQVPGDGPANDARESPLNRLLRKPTPAPEAPAGGQPATSETPASKPAAAPAPVPPSAPADVSPADLLVSKLTGRQTWSKPADKPHAQSAAPKTAISDAVDVEYTPVETPVAREPRPAQDAPATPVARAP